MIRNKSRQQLCDDEKLIAVLSDGDQAAQHQEVVEHIEQCSRCQQRFDELAAGAQDWTKARQALLNDDPCSENRVGSAKWDYSLRNEGPIAWTESMASQLLSPASHPELLGRIGRYDVERLIGSGGMGVVFKAHDSELNRPVAIKILAPYLSSSGPARKRFAREARAAAAVVHEHVVPIYNVETERETPFLVMHYIAGESLQGRIDREGALELCEILRIGMQVASGLSAAHQQGLVHRDIKPSNILMEQGVERALITDFGLARAADDASLTRTGFHPGTPQYMSPEQAAGEQVDARSDLFSLGSVLYTMCTGRPPFRAETSLGVLRRITDVEPRPIREINPDVPEWLCLLISRLMSKSLDDRFANAQEVADLLGRCLAHVQQPTSAPLPASLVPHATTGRSVFNVNRTGVMTMLGIVGMTLLGMVLWQTTEPPDISGQWTSDEWGIVVLDAKGPGQYEGTIAAPVKGQSAEGEDSGSSAGTTLGGSSGVLPGTDSSFGSGSVTTPAGTDGVLPGSSGSLPGSSGSGFPGTDISRGSSAATTLEGSSGVLPCSPGLADPGKGKSGTLQLKWSRVERRFNGTWGKGENRNGRMSLRLVGNEIRGAWTTNKEALEESGTPRLGDLLWTRSAPKTQPAESPPEAHAATVKRNADEDHGLFATNLIFTPPSMMPEGHIRSQDFGTSSVTLNLGSTQDVKVGYVFQVFRPTDDGNGVKGVIGAIRITDVQRTTSTANVLSMQFVDKFKDTDRVRRPMFYTHESGEVHISVSLTKEEREQYASLERTFAPLRALIGSKGLIAVDGGDYQDCRVSIHPPTKYDPEFVQSIADYLQMQKVISFAQVTVVRQSGADALEGADSAGTTGSQTESVEASKNQNLMVKLYAIQDLPLWSKDGNSQHIDLLINYLEARVESTKIGGVKTFSYDAGRRLLVVRGDTRKHQQIAQVLSDLRASSGQPVEDLATTDSIADLRASSVPAAETEEEAKDNSYSISDLRANSAQSAADLAKETSLKTYSIADLPIWSKDGKKQHVDLLLSYLRLNVDLPSWESKVARAAYNAEMLALVVQGTPDVHNGIEAALSGLRGRTEKLAGAANASTSNVLNPKAISMPPQAAIGTRGVVTVPDGGTVLLGGTKTTDETVPSPLKIPLGDIRVDVYAGRSVWYLPEKEVDKLLHSFKSLRGVTVQVHEDGKGDAFTKAVVHDPAPVRDEPAENQKREERIRTIKIAIDEALRAHKVPNVRWLDANDNQQDGPVGKVSAPPTNMAEPEFAFGQPQRVLNVSQVLKEGRALDESGEVVVVRFRVASARPVRFVTDTEKGISEDWWSLISEPAPYEDHPLRFRVCISPKALEELKKNGVEDIAKHFVGKILDVEGAIGANEREWQVMDELRSNILTYSTDVNNLEQIREATSDTPPVIDGSKTLDRENIRSVIEVYVAAALQGDQTTAASVAIVQGKPADPKQIEPQIQAISRSLNLKQLDMQSIYLNDWEHPTGALAISESVTHAEKQRNGERAGFVMLELKRIEEDWFVIGVEFRTKDAAHEKLTQFLEANPKSIDLPPLTPNSLPPGNPVDADQQSNRSAAKTTEIDKPLDRKNARSVVEAWVAAVIAKDVKKASSLAKDWPARANQIEGWGRHSKLEDFVIGTVKTDEQSSPARALVVSSEKVRVTLPVADQPAASFLVFYLKRMDDAWFITNIDCSTSVEQTMDHFLNGDADVLNGNGVLPLMPEAPPKSIDVSPQTYETKVPGTENISIPTPFNPNTATPAATEK